MNTKSRQGLTGDAQTSYLLKREALRQAAETARGSSPAALEGTLAKISAEVIRSFSLTYGYLMQKPAHYLPASVNVEDDVGPIKTFIQDTNCIIMRRHGFTVLGRDVSEAYHRTCVLVSEVKRNIIVETLCGITGKTPEYISEAEMAYMAAHGDAVMYPKLVRGG